MNSRRFMGDALLRHRAHITTPLRKDAAVHHSKNCALMSQLGQERRIGAVRNISAHRDDRRRETQQPNRNRTILALIRRQRSVANDGAAGRAVPRAPDTAADTLSLQKGKTDRA
jgi:hypothetical protein